MNVGCVASWVTGTLYFGHFYTQLVSQALNALTPLTSRRIALRLILLGDMFYNPDITFSMTGNALTNCADL